MSDLGSRILVRYNELNMSHSDGAVELTLGSWYSKSGHSCMRFCRDMTWHEAAYSGSCGRRFGSRSMLHGHFSFDGSTLTMTSIG